jgi:hypothetical protein
VCVSVTCRLVRAMPPINGTYNATMTGKSNAELPWPVANSTVDAATAHANITHAATNTRNENWLPMRPS